MSKKQISFVEQKATRSFDYYILYSTKSVVSINNLYFADETCIMFNTKVTATSTKLLRVHEFIRL